MDGSFDNASSAKYVTPPRQAPRPVAARSKVWPLDARAPSLPCPMTSSRAAPRIAPRESVGNKLGSSDLRKVPPGLQRLRGRRALREREQREDHEGGKDAEGDEPCGRELARARRRIGKAA